MSDIVVAPSAKATTSSLSGGSESWLSELKPVQLGSKNLRLWAWVCPEDAGPSQSLRQWWAMRCTSPSWGDASPPKWPNHRADADQILDSWFLISVSALILGTTYLVPSTQFPVILHSPLTRETKPRCIGPKAAPSSIQVLHRYVLGNVKLMLISWHCLNW